MASDCSLNVGILENSSSVVWMDPAHITFSQETISAVFSRRPLKRLGADGGKLATGTSFATYSQALKALPVLSLHKTLQDLKNGTLKVEDIPPIRVVKHNGKYWTLDNRRLWVFREHGQRIPVIIVEPPSKEFFQKYLRHDDGETVRFSDTSDKQDEDNANQHFLNRVLRWSVEDLQNERLHINKVEPIPLTFPNFGTYYKAFRLPLLEDTRANFWDSLKDVGTAAYIPIRSVEVLKDTSMSKSQLKKLKLTTFLGTNFVKRNSWEALWKPKPTDVVVLCTSVPESLEDLSRHGEHYTLAIISSGVEGEASDGGSSTGHKAGPNSVAGNGFQDDDSSASFKVTAYAPSQSPEYLEILEGSKLWYAVYLNNLATGMRIWDALNPDPLVLKDRKLVEETLCEVSKECTTLGSGHETEDRLEDLILSYCNVQGLNSSQTEAVRCTVMGLLKEENPRVRLIQGPPGTGKTSTVAALVSIVSCLKNRILVCAPTNRAISEVAERVLESLQKSMLTTSQFSDFISPGSIGMRFCRPLQMGDVLIVGNEDRLDADGILGKIFLASRKQRVMAALTPHSGWRHSAQAVANFLESPLEDYELYTTLWTETQKEEGPLLNFLQFIQRRLKVIGKNMMENGHIMCDDLPSKVLTPDVRLAIEVSCDALERLLGSLSNKTLTDKEARLCFLGGHCSDHVNCKDTCLLQSDLSCVKEKLLKLLSRKPGYFVGPSYSAPPAEMWVEELCLSHACLVFSTTSTTGRMYVRRSGPFEYAVIDEAAQLVEAETAIVTQIAGIKQMLLVGDPKQLQAFVKSKTASDCGYGRSLFERLQTLGFPCHLLNVQYRMHPAISQFPNFKFYRCAVKDGPNVQSEAYKKPFQDLYGPYAFIDVDGEEERDEDDSSWRNSVEVEVVLHLISKIRAVSAEKLLNLSMGVISPYKSQVNSISNRLVNSSIVTPSGFSKQIGDVQVDVKTVDGFQGGEKDIILFSAVRANAGGYVGFLNDVRRLNVALTRGRYCVWVIGNASSLAAQDEMWRALVDDAKKRQCYRDARNDQGLRKVILRVKRELEQFACLLHQDSILFKDTLWKVLFSKEFKETIIKMKSKHTCQLIFRTLHNLANGRRSPYPTKCVSAKEVYNKMINVQPIKGLNLVWTVDVERGDPVKQVVKIWNAVESSHILGLVRRLEAGFSTYTPAYIQRCSTVKLLNKLSKVVTPSSWKADSSFIWHDASVVARRGSGAQLEVTDPKTLDEAHLEKSNVEESILLMKFYALTSGIARQLLTAVDGSTIELLFEVNEEEAAIIQYPHSTFILGRSGTGKTTVITTRLLKMEQQFRSSINGLYESVEEGDTSLRSKEMSQPLGTEYLRQAIIT